MRKIITARRRDRVLPAVAAVVCGVITAIAVPSTASAATVSAGSSASVSARDAWSRAAVTADPAVPPSGFSDAVVLSGLTAPSDYAFASDGRIFVTERSGVVKLFRSLSDRAPAVVADLRAQVYNSGDRGLLGIALDPGFPRRPYVYLIYAYDGDIGGAFPKYGTAGQDVDVCPPEIGADVQGCVVSGRVSRFTLAGGVLGSERVLVHDWCQQFSSHSVGDLQFGPDGMLYASGGEGGSWLAPDYGQTGNPCADPPGAAGTALTLPDAQGGSLRAQSVRRPAGQPVVLGGSLIRIDPATGAGVPGNPYFASPDANKRRILAYGMRNPYRITFRPGTSEVFLGDVGDGSFEEINRVTPTTYGANFGWPCFEGAGQHSSWIGLGSSSCDSLVASGTASTPFLAYSHQTDLVPGDGCRPGRDNAAITGVAFYTGNRYPAAYRGSLFFSDIIRGCIWRLPATGSRSGSGSGSGLPNAAAPEVFRTAVPFPVSLATGPRGDLFYLDLVGGALHRITWTG